MSNEELINDIIEMVKTISYNRLLIKIRTFIKCWLE